MRSTAPAGASVYDATQSMSRRSSSRIGGAGSSTLSRTAARADAAGAPTAPELAWRSGMGYTLRRKAARAPAAGGFRRKGDGSRMKFFIDTADLAEIRDLAATGLVDGVTTNPSLVAKSGRNFLEVVREICAIVPGPVSAEVAATDHPTMLAEGRKLAKLAKNVTVKVPLTPNGLKACRALSSEGTMVNVTLCFSAAQAILAAKAGASFISPFVGRLDDVGMDGVVLIRDICQIYRQYPAF